MDRLARPPLSGAPRSAPSRAALRRWLEGRWVLYFSHPDDFARYDFEADRWHVLLETAFDEAGLRPVGPPESGKRLCESWIETVGGALCGIPRVPRGQGRYVAVFDDSLRLRRRLAYADPQSPPSPLDIAAAISVQRRQPTARRTRRLLPLKRPAAVALVAIASALALSRRAGPRTGTLERR